MKIAINNVNKGFSVRWIEYCENNNIAYKTVNCYQSDIIEQLKDCDVLMWHYYHNNFKDKITAQKILFSLEHAGIKVFPDFRTAWHFDDKVAQKYLLEAIKAPLVPSYVFYEKKDAIEWAKNTSYPKVFKLKGGAGSNNVKLLKNQSQALKIINKAFGRGFPQFDARQNLIDRFEKYKRGLDSLFGLLKGVGRLIINTDYAKQQCNEKGYVYFQEFIANEGYDVRVVVISNKAVALKRLVRKNDFRASGSGNLIFENENIDKRYIEIAFATAKKLGSQSLAIDLIHSKNDIIYIVELSYAFPMLNFLEGASGYWDINMNWHEETFNPQAWMIEQFV
jgi:glutathione synthase/RimK-type ligase-like ATP-grasp enzyme